MILNIRVKWVHVKEGGKNAGALLSLSVLVKKAMHHPEPLLQP